MGEKQGGYFGVFVCVHLVLDIATGIPPPPPACGIFSRVIIHCVIFNFHQRSTKPKNQPLQKGEQ